MWPSVLSQGHPEQISSSSTTSVNPVVYCAYVLVEDGVYEVCDLDAELVMRTVKIMEGVK